MRRHSTDSGDTRFDAFAAREPYFAVLASPEYLQANLTADRKAAFFATGETLVEYMFRLIEERMAPDFAPTSILEYGCGPGRLAIPLARRAARRGGTLVAVDRSAVMLNLAREAAASQKVDNILFQTPAELAASSRTYDFVSCCLVLQRMPQETGIALVRRLLERLAPGGVAAFSLPYKSAASAGVRISRWLRARVPLVNGVVNLARGRPLGESFAATHIYDLSRVTAAVQEAVGGTMNALLEPHQGVHSATLFIEAPIAGRPRRESIDVDSLIGQTSIDSLNLAADAYFSSLTSHEHHLAKPFSQPHETPTLLAGMAAVLQGLHLAAGTTVLEFGAGTGWFGRFLTQLGCRTILLDVSPAALDLARDLYRRLPIIGDRPEPQFLVFDGRRIDLPDRSVDRVLCYHAFHHVPNPHDVLREFGRILKPGGIAAFAEPGPRHSRSPFSQFEMRTYQVVENDVDIHDLWRVARGCGFRDLRVAIFHAPPFHVAVQEFEDFLAGGAATREWLASTRTFMRNTRTFFLTKEGAEAIDSRWAEGLASTIDARIETPHVSANQSIVIEATVGNSGRATWLPSDATPGGVSLGAHIYDEGGQLVQFDASRAPLAVRPRTVAPGETVRCRLTLPPQREGRYLIELDCVAADVAWFAPLGSHAARLTVNVS